MLDNQLTMDVSPYSSLYNIVVPKTHFLRQLTELCDFSFIYDELEKNYRPDFGRKAYLPIMMFKYLLLKDIDKIPMQDDIRNRIPLYLRKGSFESINYWDNNKKCISENKTILFD